MPMYNITVTVSVNKEGGYGSFVKASRETMAPGEGIIPTVDTLTEHVARDVTEQVELRKAAENAAS